MSAQPVTPIVENAPYGLTRLPHLGSSLLHVLVPEEVQHVVRQFAPDLQCRHTARTLVKYPDLRIVLVSMQQGARLDQHRTAARFALLVLTGHVRLHLPERTVDASAGELLALDRETPHDVEAVRESTFLLIVAWPGDQAQA